MTMGELRHVERLLRKIKLNSDGSAEVQWRDYYTDSETGEASVRVVDHPGNALVHEDLRRAFAPLNEHWMIRGNEVAEPKGNHPFDGVLKNLDRVTVTSVTFSGGEPVENTDLEDRKPLGVHIQGSMTLTGGGVKNYCLPAIRPQTPQEKYKFATDLEQHLAVIEEEAWAYVNGKCSPPAQHTMNFDAASADDGSAVQLAIPAHAGGGEEDGEEG